MRIKHIITFTILGAIGWSGLAYFKGDTQRTPADLSFHHEENGSGNSEPGAAAQAGAPNDPQEKVVLGMAKYLEQKQDSENPLAKWNDYSQARGFGDFEQEVNRYFKDAPSDKAIKILLVLNRKSAPGQTGGEEDFHYVAAAEQELHKDPVTSIAAIKGGLESIPAEGFSEERSYMLQLVGRLAQSGNDPNAVNAAKALYLAEIQRANPGATGVEANLPVMAMTSYLQFETDPKLREAAEQLLAKNHPDPAVMESYRAFNVPPAPPPIEEQAPPPSIEATENAETQGQVLQRMQEAQNQQRQAQQLQLQQQQQENGELPSAPPPEPAPPAENQSF